jgi:hypothetical protein
MQIIKKLIIHNPSDIVIGHHTCTFYAVCTTVYRYSPEGKVHNVKFKDKTVSVPLVSEKRLKTEVTEYLLFDFLLKKHYIMTSTGRIRTFHVPNKQNKSLYIHLKKNSKLSYGAYYVKCLILPVINNHIHSNKRTEVWQDFQIYK